jgi:acyl carrier protein|tara:strand:+ start:829 stop:1071 length:243 start_codon:yes stop_codon:yes gene_type:complete
MKKKINKKDFLELFIKTHPNTSLDEIKKKKYLLKEGVIDSFGIIHLISNIEKKTRKKINIGKLKVKDLRDLNSLFKFINK